MINDPKISVIMPFYNAAKFLDKSIQSILNQTFKDFEFIIINDASTDESDKIVERYLSDERIRYICNEQNVGITQNLNKGLEMALASTVARMDGDDISLPERFQKQYVFLQSHPDISFVGSYASIIDENGSVIDSRRKPISPEEISQKAIYYNPLIHPSVMFRKDVVTNLGGYRSNFRRAQDMDLWLRAIYTGSKISNIPEYLLLYRHHSNSTLHEGKDNVRNDYSLRMSIVKKYNVPLTIGQRFQIYGQYIVGYFLSGNQRRWLEGAFKKIVYGSK